MKKPNINNKEDVKTLNQEVVNFKLFEELYGSYIQVNDRFESVHIWSEELAIRNKGRWIPKLISKLEYESEKLHSWNN
jgi:hypothetical protein